MSKESKTETGRRIEMLLKERDLVRAENERLTAELAAAKAELEAVKERERWKCTCESCLEYQMKKCAEAVAAAEKASKPC